MCVDVRNGRNEVWRARYFTSQRAINLTALFSQSFWVDGLKILDLFPVFCFPGFKDHLSESAAPVYDPER